MPDFPYIEFDPAGVRVTSLMKDETALAAIRAASPDTVPGKVQTVYGEVLFPPAPDDRPYTFASIVLSSDGKMAYPDCPQGPVIASANRLDESCGATDFWILNMLRAYADGIIMGARTLQVEPDTGPYIFDEELADARTSLLGKPARPLSLVVSLDGTDVPLDHAIFSGGDPSIICTSEQGGDYLAGAFAKRGRACRLYGPYPLAAGADADAIRQSVAQNTDDVHVLSTGTGAWPDSAVLLAILRRMGIQRAMVESPSYMWHLLRTKSLDEAFVNYSMVFAGGNMTMGLNQPFTSEAHPHASLLMLGIHGTGLICTRQRLHYECM